MNELFARFVGASRGVTACLSMALGLDEEELWQHCTQGDTISLMRLFRYFPYEVADGVQPDSGRIGSSPHTDWGWLTLIMQQPDVVGLHVHHDDQWWEVPPVEGALATNIGDYVSILTQGAMVSPLHRVATGTRERTSWVFFSYPDFDAKLPVIDNCKERYSLFQDQHRDHSGESDDAAGLPFGEFIRSKWMSVSRDVS